MKEPPYNSGYSRLSRLFGQFAPVEFFLFAQYLMDVRHPVADRDPLGTLLLALATVNAAGCSTTRFELVIKDMRHPHLLRQPPRC